MTKPQQKMLLIFPVVVIASYFVHSLVTEGSQLFFWHPTLRPARKPIMPPRRFLAQAPAKLAAAPLAPAQASSAYPTPTSAYPAPDQGARTSLPDIPPELAKLAGFWRGRVALVGRGSCDMRIELRRKDEPGKFTGYSSLNCVSLGPLVTKPNAAAVALNLTDPEAAVLTGTPESGSIRFQVDKVVGTDSSGCAPTSFTVTPFGTNRIAVQWQESTCKGGDIILLRNAR